MVNILKDLWLGKKGLAFTFWVCMFIPKLLIICYLHLRGERFFNSYVFKFFFSKIDECYGYRCSPISELYKAFYRPSSHNFDFLFILLELIFYYFIVVCVINASSYQRQKGIWGWLATVLCIYIFLGAMISHPFNFLVGIFYLMFSWKYIQFTNYDYYDKILNSEQSNEIKSL